MAKKEKYKLYITYNEDSTGGESETGEEWSSRTPLYRTIEWQNAYIEHPDLLYVETVDIDFDPKKQEYVYMVVVIYEDGDTFGNSYGNWCLIGAYKSPKEAQKIIKNIENDEYCSGKKEQYKGYKPWEGYFAQFTSIGMVVRKIL